MLRRNLRRQLRYPVAAASAIGVPLVFLLLFVYVFGGTMGAGLPGVAGGRDEYLDYVTPGILLLAAAGAAQGVAISVAVDMTEGIIMAVVLGVALALGFGPTAGALDWLAAIALLAMIAFALTWLPTASMPDGMRAFAEHQPFTPMMETLRGLLMGTPIGSSGVVAAAWCAVIALSGYLWARDLYERRSA
jgi:ABC-2 type transport system permease protein